jgi:hypothetical protein
MPRHPTTSYVTFVNTMATKILDPETRVIKHGSGSAKIVPNSKQ